MACASVAEYERPVMMTRRAFWKVMRSRRIGSVMAGTRPNRVSEMPKGDRSVATTRSLAATRPTPPASVSPSTTATTGLPHDRISPTHSRKAAALPAHSASRVPASSAASRAVKSMPRQNVPPAPARRITPPGCAAARSRLSASSPVVRASSAGGTWIRWIVMSLPAAARSAPGIVTVVIAHPAEDQIALALVVTRVPAVQSTQAGLVVPAVDVSGSLALHLLVLLHAHRMAFVEHLRERSRSDHLAGRWSDQAAVELRAASGSVRVEADPVAGTEVLGPVDDAHQADHRARRVRPAHPADVAERGERLPLEVRAHLVLRERLARPHQ